MNKYMSEAIKEAYRGIKLGHGGPFGAVVVKNGKIIAKAHNHVLINKDPTAHAEICAIRSACKKLKTHDLTGCQLYATGFPCPMCLCACEWANIKKVYYAANLKDTSAIGFRDEKFYKHPIKPIEVDRKEALKLYKAYKAIKNKTMY